MDITEEQQALKVIQLTGIRCSNPNRVAQFINEKFKLRKNKQTSSTQGCGHVNESGRMPLGNGHMPHCQRPGDAGKGGDPAVNFTPTG